MTLDSEAGAQSSQGGEEGVGANVGKLTCFLPTLPGPELTIATISWCWTGFGYGFKSYYE